MLAKSKCFFSPIQDGDVDPFVLLATGILSQEKRLQAIEQRLNEMSSTSAQATAPEERNSALVKLQQSLDVRKTLPIPTRMTYLEEDVQDNRVHTDQQLQSIYDLARDAGRREAEDILELHHELSASVDQLEGYVNVTFMKVEHDIDAIKKELRYNWKWFNHVSIGLYQTIDYINHVEYHLEDRIYQLEEEMKAVTRTLDMTMATPTTIPTVAPTTQTSTTAPTSTSATTPTSTSATTPTSTTATSTTEETGDEFPTGPSVGGVGDTGGRRAGRIMSEAKKVLQAWINSEVPGSEEVAEVESDSQPSSLQELLDELNKYNM